MGFDPLLILAAVAGYLLGSIPFGLVLTRMAGLGDIRTVGSGNIGATNVLRTGRKDLALATLVLDAGKAGIACLIFTFAVSTPAGIASLETGTIAVLAGGLEHIYPPEHEALYRAIAEQGLVVSESHPRYQAGARDFPRRNRLISGLSLGVLVIEAAERSGTLITARYALEQNREVMAVPGSPLDPRARGTNRLLREGAALVETADDVIAVLQSASRPRFEEPGDYDYEDDMPEPGRIEAEADAIRESVAGLLSPTPISRDELTRQLGASAQAVMAALVELELAGRAELLPGGMARMAWPES